MKKKTSRIWMTGLVLAALCGAAYAQFAKPEDAVRYRKAVMQVLAHHFSAVGAAVQGKIPFNKETFKHDADVVHLTSGLPWEAFQVPGSDKGDTTLKSSALQEKENFLSLAEQLQTNTAKLAQMAAAGDIDGAKAQFGQVAQSCKACHGAYRKK